MITICSEELCTGCMACLNACSHNAISMKSNIEGFLHPEINSSKCVDCGACIKVCPVCFPCLKQKPINVYSGWSKDEKIRINSSSGGAFSELARVVLNNNGVVFGVKMDKNQKAVHGYIESFEDIKVLQGSKYVQSNVGCVFKQVREFLNKNRLVLFSGTPCQVAGLKKYLRKEYENLVTVDLICHGVPSPLVFEKYKSWIMKKYNLEEITNIQFRNKRKSWIFYCMNIRGRIMGSISTFSYLGGYYDDPWIRGFLREYFLRPCCHNCLYTTIDRVSDVTIADWWGYKPLKGESMDYEHKGVSLLFLNLDKSRKIIELMANNFVFRERTVDEALQTNPSLYRSYPASKQRTSFWEDYHHLSFSEIVRIYLKKEFPSFDRLIKMQLPPSSFRGIILWIYYKCKILKNKIKL